MSDIKVRTGKYPLRNVKMKGEKRNTRRIAGNYSQKSSECNLEEATK
ncbi:MAG: hypothetical protein LE168_01010 [Endomicrobium sp.]|nr:hypothetical protein [Endomicrobium sp.]